MAPYSKDEPIIPLGRLGRQCCSRVYLHAAKSRNTLKVSKERPSFTHVIEPKTTAICCQRWLPCRSRHEEQKYRIDSRICSPGQKCLRPITFPLIFFARNFCANGRSFQNPLPHLLQPWQTSTNHGTVHCSRQDSHHRLPLDPDIGVSGTHVPRTRSYGLLGWAF
jgi:hypothetical protein